MCELSSFCLNRNKELHEQTGSRRMDRDTDGQAVRNICRGNDDESETCGWCVRLAKCHSDHLKVKHIQRVRKGEETGGSPGFPSHTFSKSEPDVSAALL